MNLPEILLLLFLPIFLVPFFGGKNNDLRQVNMTISGQTFRVEVADTWLSRMRGLQNRTGIAPDQGMLFVFPRESRPGFWMKDVSFPLDVVFLNQEKTIVEVFESLPPCNGGICPTYKPSQPVKYALELPAGTIKKLNLSAGMSFR